MIELTDENITFLTRRVYELNKRRKLDKLSNTTLRRELSERLSSYETLTPSRKEAWRELTTEFIEVVNNFKNALG